ncbi:Very-long-chain (3R)-3-hydroxyacyl-CoA dehydratase hpo-8 [Cytospora mali]|uniref:Very-long-chain (3R)-3-hydroxyacyl-CoA dehydratase n=1 Tax=Cytospora mali TaxID=578113 RepID=A0A194VI08_CYTMA|nr:Very-long-chain (3R)-3-hydroxyacyl-CoA dehydratase hpo-8 [Valsa mali]
MGVFEGQFPQWVYLIGYNTISALLWAFVFSRAAVTALTNDLDEVYPALRIWVLFAQSFAALDILHSIIGLVHAPLLTTVVQVAGRCTVLWIVIEQYPSAALSPFYPWMVLAWSAADTIRYLYFATRLVGGHQYRNLTWLRYSAFYVLYPIGIASEVGVVYNAIFDAFELGYGGHAWGYIAAATLYIPAAPTLYSHMRRQRRKVIASGKK